MSSLNAKVQISQWLTLPETNSSPMEMPIFPGKYHQKWWIFHGELLVYRSVSTFTFGRTSQFMLLEIIAEMNEPMIFAQSLCPCFGSLPAGDVSKRLALVDTCTWETRLMG